MRGRQISRRSVLKGSLMASVIGGTGSFFGPLKKAVLCPVIGLARLLWGKTGGDDVRIYLAQRGQPDMASPGSTSFYFEKTQSGRGSP